MCIKSTNVLGGEESLLTVYAWISSLSDIRRPSCRFALWKDTCYTKQQKKPKGEVLCSLMSNKKDFKWKSNLQARAQSCRERRELELVQSKLPHTSASKIFVIFKLTPHKMLKTEKLVLAHFVEVDENRWRVFQSTLVHACLHLFSMIKKKKVICIFTPMVMSLIMIGKGRDRWIMW